MKILVMSDSHAALRFMHLAVQKLCPDAIVHLGDYYADGVVIAEENPHIPVHQVAGNCDFGRCEPNTPLFLCYDIGGVRIFMTHGHMQAVKSNRLRLVSEARHYGAQVALYGHTHVAECYQQDGIWVVNPGSCGGSAGSVAVIETADGKIADCRIVSQQGLLL